MLTFRFTWKHCCASLVMLIGGVGCSSEIVQKYEHHKLGAIYQDRIKTSLPLISVVNIAHDGNISNQDMFLTQLSKVQNTSPGLANHYADTYTNIIKWILSGGNPADIAKYNLSAQMLGGEDRYQNVLMTGYYSPVIRASLTPQGSFQHPILAMPKNKRFTRAEIYAGALDNQNLELAYSDSMLDNFLLGVQGSGFIDFGGTLRYFAYAGQNGFQYTSVGRVLVEEGEIPKEKMSIQAIRKWAKNNPTRLQQLLERNSSYVFFKEDPQGEVLGAAGIPLIPMASLASDRNLIPMGSVLLIEVPQIDDKGRWTGKHQLNLMMALDVGGAVKGQHFDLYQGIGEQAGHTAGLLKHYGRAWLLR